MSGKSYPIVGRVRDMRKKWTKLTKTGAVVSVNNRPRCAACGAEADCIVDVEVNWFRGDDEVVKSCWADRHNAAGLIAAHQPTENKP